MTPLIVIGIAIFGVALAVGHYHSKPVRLKRALRQTPRHAIADFPENTTGKVVGQLSYLGDALSAPLTGRACAYFEAFVEESQKHGKNSRWVTIIHEIKGSPFALSDESGRAIVDPSGSDVVVTIDVQTSSGTFDDATAQENAFLAQYGQRSQGAYFNRPLRYREGILAAGEKVAVMGMGMREPDPDVANASGGYRDAPAMRLRLGGSSKHPLVISDDLSTVA